MFLRLSVLFCLALSLCACGGGSGSASSNQNANGSHAVVLTRVSPSNLSSATSPINFDFKASSQTPIKGWTITVDSKQVYQTGSTSEMQTSLAIAAGTHQVGVNAWNSNGTIGSSNFALTVVSGSPTPTPTPTPNPSPTPTPTPKPSPTPTPTPSPTPTPTPGPITVSISPTSVTLKPSQSAQFSATVSGTSNTAVTWLVNGVIGGNSSVGSITSSGMYQSPSASNTMQVTVTAQSVANPAVSANAAVNVTVATGLNFYVAPGGSDANDGSGAHPWATIQHAADNAQPGATIHVAPGTYSSLVSNVSGTATARIRFISDTRWGAQVVGTSGTEAVWQNQGNYVDIMGFDVSGSSPNGIENLASFVAMIGNRVHDIVASCNSNGGSGINNANYSAQDNDIVANVVFNVHEAAGCTSHHGVGIYHSNLRGHVLNNISFNNGTVGIQLWHAATAVVVANNTVFRNFVNGMVIGAGDSPGGITNDNCLVVNNIVVNNAFYGIQEFGTTGPNNKYFNNLVHGNPSGDLSLQTGAASGTIIADPQFVSDTGNASGNYQLKAGSPAIDSGTTNGMPATDINGGHRPTGSGPDIGAYEMGAAPAAWPWQ
jgi:Protein of unknown function (DUF1565)